MTQRQYDAATAKALLESAYRGYENEQSPPYLTKVDGMYVNESYRNVCPPGTVFDWTPANDMDWRGSPNPDTAPFLPIPFTANELAACMLYGVGRSIGDVLDKRIGESLDAGALDAINPRHRWMRDALEEAYALGAAAQLVVGEFDHDEEAHAYALAEQFDEENGKANAREGVFKPGIKNATASLRRARAVASVADLKTRMEQAQATVAGKWKAWRKAMVRQLLGGATSERRISHRLEEIQSDEYKRMEVECDAVIERISNADEALQRRKTLLNAPESLRGISELVAVEKAVATAQTELDEAKNAKKIFRGDLHHDASMGAEHELTHLFARGLSDSEKIMSVKQSNFGFRTRF